MRRISLFLLRSLLIRSDSSPAVVSSFSFSFPFPLPLPFFPSRFFSAAFFSRLILPTRSGFFLIDVDAECRFTLLLSCFEGLVGGEEADEEEDDADEDGVKDTCVESESDVTDEELDSVPLLEPDPEDDEPDEV